MSGGRVPAHAIEAGLGVAAVTCTKKFRTPRFFLMSTTRDFKVVSLRVEPVCGSRPELPVERSVLWVGTTPLLIWLISSIDAVATYSNVSCNCGQVRCPRGQVWYS